MRKKRPSNAKAGTAGLTVASKADFDVILGLITDAQSRAIATVNTFLTDLYWSIGKHISEKIADEDWGKGTVQQLAVYIQSCQPNARGFSASNLWRMAQFYGTYRGLPKLATLLRELPWSHNLAIMSRSKLDEEREFYLRLASKERWSFRDLQRQLDGALFERVVLSPTKLSRPLASLHPDAATVFKDSYLVEFLNLSKDHAEADLHRGLVERLKDFLIELGRDFCFVGTHYPVQVGTRDFELDLLFFHRGLACLVAIELKVGDFQPEHIGKLQFYLEALDRDVKKPHEQPSIGVLLCASKNHEVVEYALSRSMSPAVVAEYHTKLPDKKLLRSKLHEFYALAQAQQSETGPALPATQAHTRRPRPTTQRTNATKRKSSRRQSTKPPPRS